MVTQLQSPDKSKIIYPDDNRERNCSKSAEKTQKAAGKSVNRNAKTT
jgi:hypothetical protein